MRTGFAAILLVASSMFLGASPCRAGWVSLPNGPVASAAFGRHDDVFFVSPDSGWVVNGAGEIHRTTDGGQSWTLQATMPNYLRSVGFATSLKGWAGALFGPPLLYATIDAGVTWTPVTNIPDPQPSGICGLWVVNDSVAYGCGRFDGPPATMIKTTDGGATWTSWDMAAYATSLIDCYFFDADHGFVVGGTGSFSQRHSVILSTSDGGATWQTRYEGDRVGAEWCWKISFPTPTDGFVSIEREDGLAPTYVLESTDAGMTWSEIPFINGYDMQGVGFVTPGMGWVGGWGGVTYETLDSGTSWHSAGFGLYVNRFRFLSPSLGYAVGDSVYKYTADATAVGGEPRRTQALALGQNLPNPMSATTRIPFSLGVESHVRVRILDVKGRTKIVLFDGVRPAGRMELTWNGCDGNGNRVGTGVYWCRVETPAESRERKLLVLR
jgi:photosystem II stability/assembly factor-like uncharacterized protein